MKFSIIVPFYNTNTQCFCRMIDSLRRQTYDNFEVIVVDDGSRKEFKELIDKFDYKDLNVKIIHQANKGLPGARNTGIRNAIGDYVVFLDSDDIIPSNMLKEACTYINEYNSPDVIFGRMVYYKDSDGKAIKITRNNCEKIDLDSYLMSMKQNSKVVQYFSGKELDKVKIKILHQDVDSIILGSSSANAYKRSVVLDCLFDESVKICEDQIFNRNILNRITTCLMIPNEWYGYIQYRSSMLHNQAKNINIEKTISYWDKIVQVDALEPYTIKHYSNIHNVGLFCDEIKKMVMSGKGYKECEAMVKQLYSHAIVKNALEDCNLYDSSINKVKLFLFKRGYIMALFYLYGAKTLI